MCPVVWQWQCSVAGGTVVVAQEVIDLRKGYSVHAAWTGLLSGGSGPPGADIFLDWHVRAAARDPRGPGPPGPPDR